MNGSVSPFAVQWYIAHGSRPALEFVQYSENVARKEP